jgi:CheY-like chemotaxis protein
VLVVDDHPDIVLTLARMLQSSGFEVRTSRDGFEALKVASEFQPTTVLLDIGLPDIDGFEVARRLRADATCKAMTIIAVTGYGDDDSRQRAKASGFDHFFVKPVLFMDLLLLLL